MTTTSKLTDASLVTVALLALLTVLTTSLGCAGYSEDWSNSSGDPDAETIDPDAQYEERPCDGWKSELGLPVEADPYNLGDDEVGMRLRNLAALSQGVGPDVNWGVKCALEEVREFPEAASDRLYQSYQATAHENRADRYILTVLLTLIMTRHATDHIEAIVMEPAPEFEMSGVELDQESGIRISAINGLVGLIRTGNDPDRARAALLRVVLEHDRPELQSRAAAKLRGVGMTEDEFRSHVEGTDAEWLIAETYGD